MEQKIKKYTFWYKFCLVLGLLGIVNITTASIINKNFNINTGGISFCILYILNFLLGTKVAAIVSVLVETILDFSLLYLIAAWIIKTKINKLAKLNAMAEK